MKTRTLTQKMDFIHRYVKHLWRCYNSIPIIRDKIDNMLLHLL